MESVEESGRIQSRRRVKERHGKAQSRGGKRCLRRFYKSIQEQAVS